MSRIRNPRLFDVCGVYGGRPGDVQVIECGGPSEQLLRELAESLDVGALAPEEHDVRLHLVFTCHVTEGLREEDQ